MFATAKKPFWATFFRQSRFLAAALFPLLAASGGQALAALCASITLVSGDPTDTLANGLTDLRRSSMVCTDGTLPAFHSRPLCELTA